MGQGKHCVAKGKHLMQYVGVREVFMGSREEKKKTQVKNMYLLSPSTYFSSYKQFITQASFKNEHVCNLILKQDLTGRTIRILFLKRPFPSMSQHFIKDLAYVRGCVCGVREGRRRIQTGLPRQYFSLLAMSFVPKIHKQFGGPWLV